MFGFRKKANIPQEVDLGSESFFQNPYPTYELLRKKFPIAPVKPAGHLLTRHQDILEALASTDLRNTPSRFSVLNARNTSRYEAARLANNILPFLDPPENKTRRQCLIRSVREQLDDWLPTLEGTASAQLNTFLQGDSDDLIRGYSSPLSLKLMCDFIGIEDSDRKNYKELSDAFFFLFAPLSDSEKFEKVNQTLAQFRSGLHQLLKKRQSEPEDDLISKLISAEDEDLGLTEDEIVDSCMLVFADGIENVEAGIANVLNAYYQDDAAQKMFAASEITVEEIVSEGLRLQTPAQFIPRIAKADTQICGTEISVESPIFLALASANRDENVFEDADKMRPGRPIKDILTFGRGTHSCVGSRLASLQISAAIKQMLEAGIQPTLQPKQIQYRPRLAHRWPVEYPVRKAP